MASRVPSFRICPIKRKERCSLMYIVHSFVRVTLNKISEKFYLLLFSLQNETLNVFHWKFILYFFQFIVLVCHAFLLYSFSVKNFHSHSFSYQNIIRPNQWIIPLSLFRSPSSNGCLKVISAWIFSVHLNNYCYSEIESFDTNKNFFFF